MNHRALSASKASSKGWIGQTIVISLAIEIFVVVGWSRKVELSTKTDPVGLNVAPVKCPGSIK